MAEESKKQTKSNVKHVTVDLKEKTESAKSAQSTFMLAQIVLGASLRQDICALARLAQTCKTFDDFKKVLNEFAEECKKELVEEENEKTENLKKK